MVHLMLKYFLGSTFLFILCCSSSEMPENRAPDELPTDSIPGPEETAFIFGADLSFVNQIQDHGGIYKREGMPDDPFRIFADAGTKLVRLRLWHDPVWTKEIYGNAGKQFYNDLRDVERSIRRAKDAGMQVLLDFHFSDTWADPGKQFIPDAWLDIKSLDVLQDSVYKYTFNTLTSLDAKGLMPEYVQLGNEINCGMLYSEAPNEFPSANVCQGNWSNLGSIINSSISAVKDARAASSTKTKIILHVADPKNVEWWFTELKEKAKVNDFDIIGFSYYPIWHTTVSLGDISDRIGQFRTKFNKDVMILETAYAWTEQSNDNYHNLFSSEAAISGYPFTQEGQYNFMVALTKEVISGGGIGVVYWEPAWITSEMKDLWGTGSSWENATLFDFEGLPNKAMQYMKVEY